MALFYVSNRSLRPFGSSRSIRPIDKVYKKPSAFCGRFARRRPLQTRPCAKTLAFPPVYIVAIAWLYVVILMSVTETNVTAGILTFVFYGLLPLSVLLWLIGTPARRRRLLDKTKPPHHNLDPGDGENSQADQGDLLDGGTELRATVQTGNQVGNRDVDHAGTGKRE